MTISRSQLEAVVARKYREQGLSDEEAAELARISLSQHVAAGNFKQDGDELVPSKVALAAAKGVK